MSQNDPWKLNVTAGMPLPAEVVEIGSTLAKEAQAVAEPRRLPRWFKSAGSLVNGDSWLNDAPLPSFGEHRSFSPDAWLGLAMLKQALAGGPAVHVASFSGNLTVPAKQFLDQIQELSKLRPVRFAHNGRGEDALLLSNDNSMLLFQLQEGGKYASLSLATIDEKVYENLAKLSSGLLTFDNPKEGFVYALAKGAMGGYHLTRIGAAGTPIERGNYTKEVLASYDHVVTDLQGESPCGRLVIMAGVPGGGKTFLARSLLSEVPKAAFVVVPPHLVRELGSPELLPALASARHDGLSGPICLIVEDADQVLVNRQAGDMSAISSLLNLGDGILGNVLDVRILATTNASKIDMDPATRRKGRLCSYVEVNHLMPDHAGQIIQRLTGKSLKPNKNVTLAEVYGTAREHGWKPPPKAPPPSPYSKAYALY